MPNSATTPIAAETLKGLPPNYELTWNHTTLRGLRVDPKITYLQTRYADPDCVGRIKRIHDHFGDLVVDKSGSLFLCTKSGTPGTWVKFTATAT